MMRVHLHTQKRVHSPDEFVQLASVHHWLCFGGFLYSAVEFVVQSSLESKYALGICIQKPPPPSYHR